MWFLNKKQAEAEAKARNTPDVVPTLDLSTTTQDRVEIQVAKNASKEAKKKAQQINTHVNDLLESNGFHVKIYIATGGHPKGGK